MPHHNDIPRPDGTDLKLALVLGAGALAAYVRTLAPDVLYSDSAEFQTLAYTLGMTHSTGYPVYLLLGRLLGFLAVGSPAWRINLLSAVGAAVTVSGVFLLARYVTRSRIGALLGSVALGISYTFWSQAIIAEVYTPGLAFLTIIVLLLWHWQRTLTVSNPIRVLDGGNRALFFAALLAGLGLGVHAFVVLVAPAAVVLVVWTLWSCRVTLRQWRRSLVAASLGLVLGIGIFLLAFFLIDINNPPSSFYQVALVSSRSIWGLDVTDLDTPLERMVVTVTGVQWQDAMFPGNIDYAEALGDYAGGLLHREFSPWMILCALLGLVVMQRAAPQLCGFVWIALITMLFLVLNYEPPDKPIFYLPTYVLIAVAMGAGAGFLLEQFAVLKWGRLSSLPSGQARKPAPQSVPHRKPGQTHRYLVTERPRWYLPFYLLPVALLTLIVVKPFGASRWQALRAGAATFVPENYVYPTDNLAEPRRNAAWQLDYFPEDALLIAEWRALYTMYYLAHVEGQRPDIVIREASPHGGEGMVADSLIQELEDALREGRPVLSERVYRNLRNHFQVQPAMGGKWYSLSLPDSS